MLAFGNFFIYTRCINMSNEMKRVEKLIEIEALLENFMKSHREGGMLRTKILFFCSIYQNLSVSMIIEKLGIKKTNFALMTAELEKDGCIVIKKSNFDRRCRMVELTDKGREELNLYLKELDKSLGNTSVEVDNAIDVLNMFLNKLI